MMKEIKTDLNSKNITEQIKVTYCPIDHFAHKMVVKTSELNGPPEYIKEQCEANKISFHWQAHKQYLHTKFSAVEFPISFCFLIFLHDPHWAEKNPKFSLSLSL
jgi:hypothetical protein